MFKRVLLLAVLYLCVACGLAHAWNIEDYKIEIKLEKDSNFVVTEEINADFGYESKHGIYRDIPTTYNDENGHPYNVQFHVLGVQDENQSSREYVEENNGNFKRIKIGSAYRTVSGRQIYIMTYRVTGAILFLSDHDELYWNAIGSKWDVNINHVHVSLYLPESIPRESLKVAIYTGARGSKTSNARSEVVSDNLITFEGEGYLPYEGFTIVVGLPKGILTPQAAPAAVIYQPMGPVSLILPVIVFVIMLNIWRRFGKDPQLSKSIVVEYKAPDDLKPAEIGTLIDSSVDQRDITSTIIDLAIRGYLKIVQQKGLFWSKEYKLVMLKVFEDDVVLKSYEKQILRSIFGGTSEVSEVKLSDLQNKFYKNLGDIGEKIKDELKPKKYLGSNSAAAVIFYTVLGGTLFFMGLFASVYDSWLMTSLLSSGMIIFLFGLVMPKRTVEGAEILAKVSGFKEFLQRTEKDKIQRADQQDIFERMLPYAICLGMSTKWAAKFDGLYTQPPQWFAGDYGGVFVYDHFIHDLDNSLSSMGSSFYSSPQSVDSGGGFSGGGSGGGGFGGGGGGSW